MSDQCRQGPHLTWKQVGWWNWQDQCDSSLRCGAESSDLPAVIKCTPGAMIFQISASAMMDDVNLISPTDLYWRKFRHLSASRCFGPSLKSGTAVAFAKCQKNRNGIEGQAAPPNIMEHTQSLDIVAPFLLLHYVSVIPICTQFHT